MWRLAALAVLGMLIAGCVTDSNEPTVAAPMGPPVDQAMQIPPSDLGCAHFCEPSIAADGAGRLWVHSQTQIRIWNDGTWLAMDRPPIPAGARPDVFQNDVLLQASPWGDMYYSALLTRFEPDLQVLVLDGLQVAWSDGSSWVGNQFIGLGERLVGDPTDGLGADRQWLTFGQDTVFLAFHQVSPALAFHSAIPPQVDFALGLANEDAILVATSQDRGLTFGAFARTDTLDYSLHTHIGGAPTVDGSGVVHAPVHRYGPLDGGMYVMRSADGSAWDEAVVDATGGTMFPALAWHATGFVAAWHGQDGTIRMATSMDGQDWGEPSVLSRDGAAVSSPWVSSGDAPLVAWLEIKGEETWLRAWHQETTYDLRQLSVPSGIRANTDFVHAVPFETGHAIVVADSGSVSGDGVGQVHVVMVPPR